MQALSPDASTAIDAYAWPGNVRELENRIKRAVIMADGKSISAADLDLQRGADDGEPRADQPARRARSRRPQGDPPGAEPHRQQISGAAKLLGISRPTLYDLLKQYRLQA